MRLFLAIDIPDDIIKIFKPAKDRLAKIEGRINLVKSYHITLKFLGEADPEGIIEQLKGVDFSSFNLKLGGYGAFPDLDRPRVVWLGLEKSKELIGLHGKIDEALFPLGFGKGTRFHPHITLARIRRLSKKEELKEALESLDPLGKRFNVRSFALYRSTLTPSGPIHEKLSEFLAL